MASLACSKRFGLMVLRQHAIGHIQCDDDLDPFPFDGFHFVAHLRIGDAEDETTSGQ